MLESRENPYWNLSDFPRVKEFLADVEEPVKRSNAEVVFKMFEECLVPKLPSFEKGFIHGDFNGLNIILNKKESTNAYHVAGVIDFGDSVKSCTIFDLGICLAYIITENMSSPSAIEFVGPVIRGYHSILPLSADELDSLYYIVLARLVQSGILGLHNFKAEPWNTYLLTTPDKAWMAVDMLLSTTKEAVDRVWKTYVT